MAAGGFKVFTTGEVLTSADTNNFLMQGVLVFDDATARDAAITAPVEGQFAYLKDTNVTTYYTGSAWANLDTTGMTNPMTTTADMIYSSSGSTPARLGIGTAGQVLSVNSGATAPEWAAPAGGGKVLQVVSASTSTVTTIASTTLADTGITATITPTSATSKVLVLISAQSQINRDNDGIAAGVQVLRGATQIVDIGASNKSEWQAIYVASATTVEMINNQSIVYLDTPATTSATTYKLQAACSSTANSGVVRFQRNSAQSTITLLEIGA